MTAGMTKSERDSLASLIRQRARVQRAAAAQRAAELRTDVVKQLNRRYHFDEDQVWKDAFGAAEEVTREAQKALTKRCEELGIPARFAPRIKTSWYEGGARLSNEERRMVLDLADKAIDAAEKRARTKIEADAVQFQTELISGALTSEAAKAFLAKLPDAQDLMPALDVEKGTLPEIRMQLKAVAA